MLFRLWFITTKQLLFSTAEQTNISNFLVGKMSVRNGFELSGKKLFCVTIFLGHEIYTKVTKVHNLNKRVI